MCQVDRSRLTCTPVYLKEMAASMSNEVHHKYAILSDSMLSLYNNDQIGSGLVENGVSLDFYDMRHELVEGEFLGPLTGLATYPGSNVNTGEIVPLSPTENAIDIASDEIVLFTDTAKISLGEKIRGLD